MILHKTEMDDFLPDPFAAREAALALPFGPKAHEGVVYKGVAEDPGLVPAGLLEQALGRKVSVVYSFFRAGTEDWETNTWIHADNATYGQWAAVLYLCHPPAPGTGTAFWRNKALGTNYLPNPDFWSEQGFSREQTIEALKALDRDGGHQDLWDFVGLTGHEFNRCVVYPTCVWHSRFPRAGWGKTPEDGRLTWGAFFNLVGE